VGNVANLIERNARLTKNAHRIVEASVGLCSRPRDFIVVPNHFCVEHDFLIPRGEVDRIREHYTIISAAFFPPIIGTAAFAAVAAIPAVYFAWFFTFLRAVVKPCLGSSFE
jgi:hypothetical protein